MIIGIKVWLILSLFLICSIDSSTYICLTYEQMKKALSWADVTIIDLRDLEPYIYYPVFRGSINIPENLLYDALTLSNEGFRHYFGRDLPKKTSPLVFVNIDSASPGAVSTAKYLNFTRIYDYCGGHKEWQEKQKEENINSTSIDQ